MSKAQIKKAKAKAKADAEGQAATEEKKDEPSPATPAAGAKGKPAAKGGKRAEMAAAIKARQEAAEAERLELEAI